MECPCARRRVGLYPVGRDLGWGSGPVEATGEQRVAPRRPAPVVRKTLRGTRTHHDAPSSGIRHNDRLVQNCSQPFVGRERLILHNADGGEVTGDLGIEGLGRFELDQLIEHGEEGDIRRRDGVDLSSTPLDERDRLGLAKRPQRSLAGQEGPDACSIATGT